MRKRELVLAALLSAVALAAFACKDAEAWLKQYGYTSIRPPSTLLQPGTIIMKKRFEQAGTRILCSAEESLGPDFRPRHSKTTTGRFLKSKTVGFHVGADVLEQIHLKSASDAIDSIYVDVQNARVYTLSDSDVVNAVAKRSPGCQAAIARRKAAGADISMIASALVADATYALKYKKDANLDASAKLAQAQQVAIALGGNIQTVNEDQIQAQNLVWGITDSRYLAAIGVDDEDIQNVARAQSLKRQSMLSPNDVLFPNDNNMQATPVLMAPIAEEQEYDVDDTPLFCPVPQTVQTEEPEPPKLPVPSRGARVPPHLRTPSPEPEAGI